MASDEDSGFAPSEIAKKEFPTTFRGYDQDKVRDYLRRLSFFLEQQDTGSPSEGDEAARADLDSSDDLAAENRSLRRRVKQLEIQSGGPEADAEGAMVFELLGNETTRILETARSAASDIIRRAEERSAELLTTSETEAKEVRREAQDLLAAKQTEAASLTSKITEDARRHADRLVADGENKHKRSLAESSRILSEAQDRAEFERASSESEANEILEEASKRREEILTDLVERRREGHHQLNQLASARNALVRSLTTTSTELGVLLAALSEKIELTASASYVNTVESKLDEVAALAEQLDIGRQSGIKRKPVAPKTEIDLNAVDETDLVELKLEDLPTISNIEEEISAATAIELEDPDSDPDLDALLNGNREPEIDDDTEQVGLALPTPDLLADESPHSQSSSRNTKTASSTKKRPSKSTTVAAVEVAADSDLDIDVSPFEEAEELEDQDFSKEIPLLVYKDGKAEPVLGDRARAGQYEGELDGEFIARDVAITRFGPALRRRMRRALNDDQSDVLNRLRGGGGQRHKSGVSPEDLPSVDEQLKVYLEPLETGLVDLADAGLVAGGGQVLPTDALHHLALQVAKHMVQNLRAPSLALVEKSTDGDREALHDPIRDLYRAVRSNVLEAVIEDALNEAFSLGLFAGLPASSHLRWVLDPRCEPSPLCEINAAAHGVEKSEAFPSGHTRPLAMPGCRCLVLAESKD